MKPSSQVTFGDLNELACKLNSNISGVEKRVESLEKKADDEAEIVALIHVLRVSANALERAIKRAEKPAPKFPG